MKTASPQFNQSDSELLARMLAGDEAALAALYGRRHGGVFRFALQMSGSRALAEDVTQEVFMMLMRNGTSFDSSRGSLNAFLFGVARNLVRQRLSREQFYVSFADDADETKTVEARVFDPFDELSRDETIESVRRAVLSLPTRYREVVVLCDLQEMSYADVAVALGCAIGTVRSRLHRARLLLLEKLRPAREESSESALARSARCFA